jgi:hypothetical protein
MSRVIVFSFVAILWTSDLWNQSNAAESPKVFQVEASGQAGITRIQAAVDAAPAGSIIRIVSGIFHEAALISKPLTRERAGVDRTFLSANWVDTREIIFGGKGDGKGVPDTNKEEFTKLRNLAIEQENGEGPLTMQRIQTYGP